MFYIYKVFYIFIFLGYFYFNVLVIFVYQESSFQHIKKFCEFKTE